MVAIFSGNGTGLGLATSSPIGLGGALGQSSLGQTGEQLDLNAGNGNLVVQDQDMYVETVGTDISILRTYNAQSAWNDDNGDGWMLSVYRNIGNVTGTVNTAGSTVQRVGEDGTVITYSYDTTRQLYVATAGTGAADTLVYTAGNQSWTWTNATTRTQEVYQQNGTRWRLASSTDHDGNQTTYAYNGNLIASVTGPSGDKVTFTYTGNNLTSESAVRSDGVVLKTTFYTYDTSNRLQQVKVDLAPSDNSISDGNVYTTTYTYQGATNNLASILQSNGNQVSFTWGTVAGSPALTGITDALGRQTTIGYDRTNLTTTVTDAQSNKYVYKFDSATGLHLTQATGPTAVGVTQQYQYQYDSFGRVTKVTDAIGNATTYTYDANGNKLTVTDALGDRTEYTYSTTNQVLTSTVYRTPINGTTAAQDPETTRYVYDASNNLRFVITPEGNVTENRYTSQGLVSTQISYPNTAYSVSGLSVSQSPTLAQMTTWSSGQSTQATVLTEYVYNPRGQLSQTTEYGSAQGATGSTTSISTVSTYSYNALGQLLQKARGNNVVSYTYDGLNRLLTATDSFNQAQIYQYDDANNKIVHTLQNGRVETSAYDADGELLSVVSGGQTQASYQYDTLGRLVASTDATGIKQYYVYDASGNLQAQVDGNGSVTHYVYNALGLRVKTIKQAVALTAAQISALPGSITYTTNASDQVSWTLYDAAGRVGRTINASGGVTEYQYDGAGNLISKIQRFTAYTGMSSLTATSRAQDVNVTANATNDRKVLYYYDHDNNLIGTIDGEGDLTRYNYDANDRLVETVRYAKAVTGATTASNLVSITPAANVADQHTYLIYDGRNNVVGKVDAEGYLTESNYDSNGNLIQSKRYANKVTATITSGVGLSLAAVRPSANPLDQVTSSVYDSLARLTSSVSPEGVTTQYTYNALNNVLSVTVSGNGETRQINERYDQFGRLTGTLSGQGSALLLPGMTQTQVDAVWAQYGTTYAYDAAGRRVSMTDPNGNRTLYYYDKDGHLIHTINALGEVQESQYNALGQVSATIAYSARLTNLSSFTGGLVTTALTNAVAQIANSAADGKVVYKYDVRGMVSQVTDQLNNATAISFNTFSEETSRTEHTDIGVDKVSTHTYDRRGLVTATNQDKNGVAATTKTVYDAFGRVTSFTDPNGKVSSQSYDRLGRVVKITDPTNASRSTTYDAFNRVLTQSDALNHITTYSYSDTTRSYTVTSAEGVTMSVVHNNEGQTQKITDGNGNVTTYSYDADGNLLSTATALGTVSNQYDAVDHLVKTTDANGNIITYTYDAVGRVLTRTQDPSGLALVTSYQYDAKGEVVSVTDAKGIVTSYTYDAKGRVLTQIVDPSGLNATTTYTYDLAGDVLTVTAPGGMVTSYYYDAMGRRLSETVDVNGQALATYYSYDKNGNAVYKIDAAGNLTRYVYDADNRLVYTIDGISGVQKNTYDANGNLTATTAYAFTIDSSSLSETSTVANVAALITASIDDAVTYRVYNKDNQLTWTVDGTGAVTSYVYDGNGNVVDRVAYANRIDVASWTKGTVPVVTADAAHDLRLHTVYNAGNRAIYTVNGTGAVTAYKYDANGNVVDQVSYSTPMALANATDAAHISAAVANVADAARDMHSRMVYDAANRLIWRADGAGAVTQYVYDKDGNVVKKVAYAAAVSSSSAPSSVSASANDQVSLFTYDNQGRQIYAVDALGRVTKNAYDAAGNLVQKIAYATTIGALTASSPIATTASIAASVHTDAVNDRTTLWVYNSANRATYVIDSLGDVTQNQYDGVGHLVASTSYAKPISTASLAVPATEASVASLLQVDSAHDRVTQYAYDGTGRLVYVVDSLGYVKQTSYDAVGRISATRTYAIAVSVTAPTTADAVTAALHPSDDHDEVDSFDYDAAGHLIHSTDALGYSESFTYDANGNKLTYTNKSGATWNYAYDAAGHLTSQTAPAVSITNVAIDTNGNLIPGSTSSVAVVTAFTYDAFGNVLTQTEAQGRPEQRITSYQYDALGRQIKVIYPAISVYSSSGDNLATNGANGIANRTETTVQPYTQVTYDIFGNAVANRDVNGNYSYKTYDKDNRVQYEIDAAGYVTGYGRNLFGDVTSLTRYATAPQLPTSAGTAPSSAQVASALQAVSSAQDRAISYVVDQLGRTTQVTQPQVWTSNGSQSVAASAVTRNTYDAFGQLVRVSILADAANNTWNTTTRYFDGGGRSIATIDVYGNLTQSSYDAMGNLIGTREYATAVTSWNLGGYTAPATSVSDHVMAYSYDQANRKTSQTVVGMLYADVAGDYANGTRHNADVTTTYGYDAVGNQISVTDPYGYTTYTYYDAQGRVAATAMPVEYATVSGTEVTPLTVYKRDALGNVTVQIQYANGASAASETGYTAGASTSADRTTLYRYDSRGDTTQTTNANGISQFSSYDAAGQLMKVWQGVTGNDGVTHTLFTAYQYDVLGRQINTITPGSNSVAGAVGVTTINQQSATVVQNQSQYNAFGELTKQGVNGVWQVYYDYDAAGRLWHTNSGDGVDKVFLYDAQGTRVSVITSAGAGVDNGQTLANTNLANVTSAQAVESMAGIRRVDSTVDLLGRAVTIKLASRDGTRPTIQQTFDRWGNVLSRSSLNGANSVTLYRYDTLNHLITQTDPDANGQQSANSPVTQVFYDQMGRQVAMKDANGYVTARAYDGSGNLVQEIHADGGVVQNFYDAFGSQTATTDAVGNTILYSVDNLGRRIKTTSSLSVDASGTPLATSSKYDEAGRLLWSQDPTGNKTLYTYDLRGNQTSKTKPMGQVERYAYDNQGKEIAYVDANGNSEGWGYNYFGYVQSHKDLGGVAYGYSYDAANQLVSQTNGRGEQITTVFDAAGQVVEIKNGGTGQVTLYAYNIAGQHIREQTILNGKSYQDNWLAYDAAGRLARVDGVEDGVSVIKSYDRVGNLVHIDTVHQAEIASLTSRQVVIDGVTTTVLHDVLASDASDKSLWYAYDSMRHQIMVDGAVDSNPANAANINASQGHLVTYDLNGNRVTDKSWGEELIRQYAADGSFSLIDFTGMVTRYYEYDALGRVSTVSIGSIDTAGNSMPQDKALLITEYLYDANGNTVSETIGARGNADYLAALAAHPNISSAFYSYERTYDANGKLLTEDVSDPHGNLHTFSDYSAPGSYDAAGNVLHYTVTTDHGNQDITISYIKEDSYLRSQVVVVTNNNGSSPITDTTNYTYDVDGNLIKTVESAPGATSVVTQFVRDAQGNTLDTYKDGMVARRSEVNGSVLESWNSAAATDSHTPRVEAYDESGNARVQIKPGDTLQSLAQMAYGDSKLWYVIADANGLANNAGLVQGSYISIPTVVGDTVLHSDTSWAGKATTTNSDFWQMPHVDGGGGGGCGGIGSILTVVVAVVATIYTAGAAAGLLGVAEAGTLSTFSAGLAVLGGEAGLTAGVLGAAAIGGAVGSIAGQAVGNITGDVHGFNWSQVGISAIASAATAGIGSYAGGGAATSTTTAGATSSASSVPSWLSAGARAAAGSVLTQGVAVATGLQSSFNWTNVAAAGMGGAVGSSVSTSLGSSDAFNQAFGSYSDVARNTISGLARGSVASLASGGHVDVVQVAIDSFGNALGNGISERAAGSSQQLATLTFAQDVANRKAANYWAPEAVVDNWDGSVNGGDYATSPSKSFTLNAPTQDNQELINTNNRETMPGYYSNSVSGSSYTAVQGDSIARILGTSDPQAIGNFMRANGLSSSALRAGDNYFIPDSINAYGDSRDIGQATLNADNARLAQIRQLAEQQRMSSMFMSPEQAADIYTRYGGRNSEVGAAIAFPAISVTRTTSGDAPIFYLGDNAPFSPGEPSSGPSLSYGEEMSHLANFAGGVLGGALQGVPKMIMGATSLGWRAAEAQTQLDLGKDPATAYSLASQSTKGWPSGEFISYTSPEAKFGDSLGEFASPFAFGKAPQVGGAAARWLAPAFDDFVYNQGKAFGFILNVVEDTGISSLEISSSRKLGAALEAAGDTRPIESAAHHMVAGKASAADPARVVLQRYGVGINSAENGVFLPRYENSYNPAGAAVHGSLHGTDYYETVNEIMSQATSRQDVLDSLKAIKQMLLNGGLE